MVSRMFPIQLNRYWLQRYFIFFLFVYTYIYIYIFFYGRGLVSTKAAIFLYHSTIFRNGCIYNIHTCAHALRWWSGVKTKVFSHILCTVLYRLDSKVGTFACHHLLCYQIQHDHATWPGTKAWHDKISKNNTWRFLNDQSKRFSFFFALVWYRRRIQ